MMTPRATNTSSRGSIDATSAGEWVPRCAITLLGKVARLLGSHRLFVGRVTMVLCTGQLGKIHPGACVLGLEQAKQVQGLVASWTAVGLVGAAGVNSSISEDSSE